MLTLLYWFTCCDTFEYELVSPGVKHFTTGNKMCELMMTNRNYTHLLWCDLIIYELRYNTVLITVLIMSVCYIVCLRQRLQNKRANTCFDFHFISHPVFDRHTYSIPSVWLFFFSFFNVPVLCWAAKTQDVDKRHLSVKEWWHILSVQHKIPSDV